MGTETTNSPARIARNPKMVSVNTALQVDLFGCGQRLAASTPASTPAFGGQTDFIVGALHSAGGQAFIALASWHPKADCSTIVPLVDEPGDPFQMSAVDRAGSPRSRPEPGRPGPPAHRQRRPPGASARSCARRPTHWVCCRAASVRWRRILGDWRHDPAAVLPSGRLSTCPVSPAPHLRGRTWRTGWPSSNAVQLTEQNFQSTIEAPMTAPVLLVFLPTVPHAG